MELSKFEETVVLALRQKMQPNHYEGLKHSALVMTMVHAGFPFKQLTVNEDGSMGYEKGFFESEKEIESFNEGISEAMNGPVKMLFAPGSKSRSEAMDQSEFSRFEMICRVVYAD